VRDLVRTSSCERARAWVSLALDGELSELERRLLEAHVSRCADCAAFGAQVEALVTELRSAPPEPVPCAVRDNAWRRRPVAPAMRVVSRVAAATAAAAAGLAMFTLGAGSVGNVDTTVTSPAPIILDVTSISDTAQEIADLRDARRAVLLSTIPEQPVSGTHTGINPL
jgi:anti-sigma factor RsiW